MIAIDRTRMEIKIENDWEMLPERFAKKVLKCHCFCPYDRLACFKDMVPFFSEYRDHLRFNNERPTCPSECPDNTYANVILDFEREVNKLLGIERINEPSIENILGIGPKIGKALTENGFGTLLKLSMAEPEDVSLRCSMSLERASYFIEQARMKGSV